MRLDFDAEATPIGVEITAPAIVTIAQLNAVLAPLGISRLEPEKLAPLAT